MLEWYRLGFDQHQLMDEVEALLTKSLGSAYQAPAERLSYQAIFERYLAIDPHLCPIDTLRALCREHAQADLANADRDTLLNALIGIVIGPQLGHDRLTFVHDFPASQAALARLLPGNPPVAARFEAYARGLELCNGFHELTQPDEQRRRFEQDLGQRAALGLPAVPLDERLIAALKVGLPDCAGVAVGLDRVLMVAMGAERIQDVLAFAVTEC
jgi:lysyl-tRNA synthetase class 2